MLRLSSRSRAIGYAAALYGLALSPAAVALRAREPIITERLQRTE